MTMQMPSITRSSGILIGGYNPGGGRTGITAGLDAVVAEAAERLRTRFDVNVEIRFNSDRQSGGAYLKQSATLGITAQLRDLRTLRHPKMSFDDETFEDICARLGIDPTGPEQQITTAVMIDQSRLIDPTQADHGVEGRRYAYVGVGDLDAAITIIDLMIA